jgi:hypothetical protein
MNRRRGSHQRLLERRAAVRERLAREIVVGEREQVEGDERGRSRASEQRDARRGRVDALLKCPEVEAAVGGDDDLAVDDRARREVAPDGGHQLGEVARQRSLFAAADLDLVAIAEHDRAKAVPLGLVELAWRNCRHRLGQHRRDRRHDGKPHDMTACVHACTRRLAAAAQRHRKPRARTPRRCPHPQLGHQLSLSDEAVAQSRLGNAAARPRKCTREQPCAATSRRTACPRRMRWPFSELTLRTDPGSSPGVYATASDDCTRSKSSPNALARDELELRARPAPSRMRRLREQTSGRASAPRSQLVLGRSRRAGIADARFAWNRAVQPQAGPRAWGANARPSSSNDRPPSGRHGRDA